MPPPEYTNVMELLHVPAFLRSRLVELGGRAGWWLNADAYAVFLHFTLNGIARCSHRNRFGGRCFREKVYDSWCGMHNSICGMHEGDTNLHPRRASEEQHARPH